MRCERDNLVHISSAPACRHMVSAAARGRDRQRHVRPDRGESRSGRPPVGPPAASAEQGHQALAVAEDAAVVVDQRDAFAVGAEHRTEIGARRPHQRRHPPGVLEAVEADRAPGGRVRVDRQDLGPELAEDGGHDERRRAEGVVEDDLEARRPDGAGVDLVDQGLGVEVGDARRVDDVARLGGQAAAEVLAVEEPLDLALGQLSEMSMPSGSKKRRTTDWGSSWARRTVTPPALCSLRTPNRVTGTVATSRSSTLTPAALKPTISARLSTRAARLVSREAATVAPFSACPWPRPWPGAPPVRG